MDQFPKYQISNLNNSARGLQSTLNNTKLDKLEDYYSSFAIFNFKLNLEHKLIRLTVFIGFFLLIVLIILIMSKIYIFIRLIKYRYRFYGFYINPNYERLISGLNRTFSKTNIATSLSKKFNCKNENQMKNLRINYRDCGHINEVFQAEDLLTNEIRPSLNNNEIYSIKRNKKKNFKEIFFKNFVFKKRFKKSFDYMKLENASSYSLNSTASTRISNTRSFFSTSFSSYSFQDNSSLLAESTLISSIKLPVILVTDTTSMNTIIVDLDEI